MTDIITSAYLPGSIHVSHNWVTMGSIDGHRKNRQAADELLQKY